MYKEKTFLNCLSYNLFMLLIIILNFLVGLLGGFILELIYRSSNAKKLVLPKLINIQMYGVMSVFLTLIYFINMSLVFKLILIFIIPTLIEFLTGYLYLKTKGIRLWDYSKEKFNFMGIICLRFSLVWFIISVIYYYLFQILQKFFLFDIV